MTGLLIALGLAGKPHLAADVAIVQGAALALFYSFSGNARNLIFKAGRVASASSLLAVRLLLVVPLGIGVYYLGSVLGGVAWDISLILILRKAVEWLCEIHLSEAERDQEASFAWRHLALQSALLIVAALWTISGAPGSMLALSVWALMPLFLSFSYLRAMFRRIPAAGVRARMLFPHFGSTAIVGIGVYLFRLTLLLLVDKATAGNLFTAFAIGGALGSVFSMGLGPSLVLHEQKTGRKQTPSWLRNALILTVLAGITLALAARFLPMLGAYYGKDPFFWQAVGLSLVGGVVMVLAQRQRLRDLQNGTEDDVFAPDVLVNTIIVAIIPFVYFVFGRSALSSLYLLNAIVALVFYSMADRQRAEGIIGQRNVSKLWVLLPALLVFPVFVNLETGLFRSPLLDYDSGGQLSRLPLPISMFACYFGIALLGSYQRASLGLGMIFWSFVFMALSTVAIAYPDPAEQQAKMILLVQYIVPMFGLVLGMIYGGTEGHEYLVEKSVLVVIVALVPVQLTATWVQGQPLLTPNLYLFSIYQHLQYVPVVVVCSYLLALYSLWNVPPWKHLIIMLSPAITIYAIMSGSLLAVVFCLAGGVVFLLHRLIVERERGGQIFSSTVMTLMVAAGAVYHLVAADGMGRLLSTGASDVHAISNVTGIGVTNDFDGSALWGFYLRGAMSDLSSFLLGHAAPPDRSVLTSAHNYYLDFIYNFGAVAALVIIGMIGYTAIRIYRSRGLVMSATPVLGLTLVTIFLLLPDNLVKVGMRQPYPGIITFFLWGLLLTRIRSYRPKSLQTAAANCRGLD